MLSIFFGMSHNLGAQENRQSTKRKILVGSPTRKKQEILREFLISLKELRQETVELDFFFVDDNDQQASSDLLREFAQSVFPHCFIHKASPTDTPYVCTQTTHHWDDKDVLVWRVAGFKNFIIDKALQDNYDYLFFIDSDLVIHPDTIEHLVATEKDIISEIFWTRWKPEQDELPQVWISDFYTLNDAFIRQLRSPGVYEVGGLGACTLISKRALQAGVNFNKIYNLTFWGEDRHFCIRAGALGIHLYVDTLLPAYHIFRESELAGLEQYKKNNTLKKNRPAKKHTLTLSMCIKNEADRYLRDVLTAAREYIDEAVIIDDGSTDASVEICKEILKDIPLHIVCNQESKFANEVQLRQQQWNETIKTNPDWILVLDADEIFEENFKYHVAELMNQDEIDVYYFRLYDFWSKTQYREDQYWCAHHYYRPFLVRYKKDFPYAWKMQAQHCGRLPENISQLPYATPHFRLKHYGWANKKHRIEKYARYNALDPHAQFGIKEQYESILDESPHLIEWVE